jgi:acyl-CoA reductase-like NAD-dependent aldehyde dehydrogenase
MNTITENSVTKILQTQRQYFATGQTKEIDFRLSQLKKLKQAVQNYQQQIVNAVKADLNRPEFEAYFEIGAVAEINYALKNLTSWVKPRKIATGVENFPGNASVIPEPLGVVLIIGPWNYPFQLMISPLVGAIAAGNCAILKPSELAPHTAQVITELIESTFDPAYIAVVNGGVETSQILLKEKFDHIFFTGGTKIGKIVMQAAAEYLTPVTLELGGKSPCIVDHETNLATTAKRIVWGKFINAGQTCIAPDYILAHRQIKPQLLEAMQNSIQEFYGENPAYSPDYARIINDHHWQRLTNLLDHGHKITGGETNQAEKYIAPTIITDVSWDDPIMADEIFGPILPVLEYENLQEAIALINQRPKPLALYLFSQDKQKQELVLKSTSSGGVCINDTVMQVGVNNLPFGGVGDSGMGAYHGKASFDTFSHYKSILRKGLWFDLKWRYAPYRGKLDLLKKVIFG